MCHEWYVGMIEAELKPEGELKRARGWQMGASRGRPRTAALAVTHETLAK
jgi:hypothetical protein